MKEQYMTKEGLADMKERLHSLKTVRRREIADAIHAAKEQGDLSENAEYQHAKEEQRRIEEQIAELEASVKHAHVITKKKAGGAVDVGSTITLICGEAERTYQIVGSTEADPLHGKISNESPMGRALLGHEKDAEVHIPTPVGDKACRIVDVA